MASRPSKSLRVLVDANLLVAGIGWPRFPYEVLRHALLGDFQLVLSPLIIEEVETALARIAPAWLDDFRQFLADCEYEMVESPSPQTVAEHITLVRDPKDVHVALVAIHAGVDLLLTQDRDFTDKDETTEALLHQALMVMLPGTFLREVVGWSSEDLERVRLRTWEEMPPPDEEPLE